MFDTLKTSELESKLVSLAGRIAAEQCHFLLLLAEFNAREGWAGPGIRSCSHWLTWRVGLGRRAAREQVRVAVALAGLPLIADEFGAGRLSYSKVRAITRVATAADERVWLELALAGTAAHVERVVRAARSGARSGNAFAAGRSASWYWDEDGYLVLRAKLPPEAGALLVTALETQLCPDGRGSKQQVEGEQGFAPPSVGVGEAEPGSVPEPRAAPDLGGGSAEPPPAGSPSQLGREDAPGTGAPRVVDRIAARRADALMALLAPDLGQHKVVLHLEVASGEARLDDGPSVASSTAERLACDARVQALIKDRNGNPLYLGRSHRGVNATQRAVLLIRDQHRCQFPGCENQRFLHAHHVRHWLHGGPTDIDNLVLVCGFHHRLMHDLGYRATFEGNWFRVWRDDGTEVTAQHPPVEVGDELTSLNLDYHIGDEAIVPSWSGERLDLDAILALLLPALANSAT